jgi:hypothetical protein
MKYLHKNQTTESGLGDYCFQNLPFKPYGMGNQAHGLGAKIMSQIWEFCPTQ